MRSSATAARRTAEAEAVLQDVAKLGNRYDVMVHRAIRVDAEPQSAPDGSAELFLGRTATTLLEEAAIPIVLLLS